MRQWIVTFTEGVKRSSVIRAELVWCYSGSGAMERIVQSVCFCTQAVRIVVGRTRSNGGLLDSIGNCFPNNGVCTTIPTLEQGHLVVWSYKGLDKEGDS